MRPTRAGAPGCPRFRRRPGSVLVLSVVLVVLMALLGTALLVSARGDHWAARQNSFNTQVDLLAEGVCRMVKGALVDDLFGGPDSANGGRRPFRPGYDPTGAYTNCDSPAVDRWLASRVPEVSDDRAAPTAPKWGVPTPPAAPGHNPPIWRAVSWPLTGSLQFQGPGDPSGFPPLKLDPATRTAYSFAPTVGAADGNGTAPFLIAFRDGAPVPLKDGGQVQAADTDGDGVADAGLWPLTGGPVEGLSWYAAVRVVDNNAAINVNTALSRDVDFDGRGRAVRDSRTFSPARVGLAELLRTYNPAVTDFTGPNGPGSEVERLNGWRLNGTIPAGVFRPGAPGTAPVGDDGQRRDDFRYSGVADALWSQLGRRIDHPGRLDADALARPFGAFETGILAHHLLLPDPGRWPRSPLEQVLAESLTWTGSRWPLPAGGRYELKGPGDVLHWYDQFDYAAEVPGDPSTYRSLRPLLVARNAVSNLAPARFSELDTNGDGLRNDVPHPQMEPYGPKDVADPVVLRTDINTAGFAELWRAFWCVMCDEQHPDHAPFGETNEMLAAAIYDPFYGNRGDVHEVHPAFMFRSSIRDLRTGLRAGQIVRFDPGQQMLLRAALAAVNAEDLRDADDDVSSHAFLLRVERDGDVLPAAVVVYGTERQPYITEVFINYNQRQNFATGDDGGGDGPQPNKKGYIAIELFNPYDEPILLAPPAGAGGGPQDGWSIGMIDRNREAPPGIAAKPSLRLRNLDGTSGAPAYRFPPGTFVPPKGYLVLENYDATGQHPQDEFRARSRPPDAVPPAPDGAPVLPRAGNVVPPGMNARLLYVPNLHRLIGDPAGETGARSASEFVLLRTRSAFGFSRAGSVTDAAGGTFTWDERASLNDLVPVEQFDLTGLSLPAPDDAVVPSSSHFPRKSEPDAAWRFVWPGLYDAEPYYPDLSPSRWNPALGVLVGGVPGLGRGGGPRNDVGFQIQLAGPGFGGPHKVPASGWPYRHPFGAFARNGDILQVPFIGAYTVYDPAPPAGEAPGLLLEMNAVTTDTMFAHDTDYTDDYTPREQVGRFVPLDGRGSVVHDASPDGSYDPVYRTQIEARANPWPPLWRYRWAMDLFDYVTVQSPANDYWPGAPPRAYTAAPDRPPPVPVSNAGGAANGPGELAAGVEGLININTAPAKVLSALPLVVHPADFVPPPPGQVYFTNESMARLIARFRDHDGVPEARERVGLVPSAAARVVPYGAFRSAYELNFVVPRDSNPDQWGNAVNAAGGGALVWGDVAGWGTDRGPVAAAATPSEAWDAGPTRGDFAPEPTPANPLGGDGVRNDFEEYFLAVNRISNLITTRSDSYTCYVVVQGWADAGTPNARMVVQRRVAFIADRSGVTPTNRDLRTQLVPND